MATAPAVAKELLAYAAHGVLLGMGSRWRRHSRPGRGEGPRTTFLLHGYLAGGAVLLPLQRRLQGRVTGDVVIFHYGGTLDIGTLAGDFGRFVAQIAPAGRIDIVAHSLGGLVARAWMVAHGGGTRVDRLITLGTPHLGTESARLWPFGAARDLVPDAPFLSQLAARAGTLGHVRTTCVVAEDDLMVRPAARAALPGSMVHRLDDLGHNGLLFSRRVFRIVEAALQLPSSNP